jgi:uncharacterized protein YoxC
MGNIDNVVDSIRDATRTVGEIPDLVRNIDRKLTQQVNSIGDEIRSEAREMSESVMNQAREMGDQIKNEKRRLNSILMLHSRIFAVNPKTKNMKI